MKKQLVSISIGIACMGILFSACKKDKDKEENDNEVITTMIVNLTPTGGGTTLQYQFNDPDGPGGTAPTKDVITLATNKSYSAEILLLDKTKSPVDTVSEEVAEEEPDAHRFYFTPTAGSNITVSNLDTDPNGVPLGITSTWASTTAATGTITITLRHYPNKGKAASDLVTSTKSSTDMEVTFDTKVQ